MPSSSTSFVDTDVAELVDVSFRVQAVGANAACESAVSSCQTTSLRPLAGRVEFTRAAFACGQALTLRVVDGNVGAGPLTVRVWSDSEQTPEFVDLVETAPGSGRFEGSLPAAPGAPVAGDGQLAFVGGDQVTAEYTHTHYGSGSSQVVVGTSVADCGVASPTSVQVTDITGGSQAWVCFNMSGGTWRGPFLLWTGGAAGSSAKYANILGIVKDDFPSLYAACAQAMERCDMVLVSGGSSVGTRDYTVEAISAFSGSQILVHGIAISPGNPTILARVGRKALWGLPGHVVSAMIVFSRIARPFLRRIGGQCDPCAADIAIPARLSRSVASAQGRTDFIRVRLTRRNAEWWAQPVLGKSGLLNTMVHSDGVIEIGKNTEGLIEGAPVEVIMF